MAKHQQKKQNQNIRQVNKQAPSAEIAMPVNNDSFPIKNILIIYAIIAVVCVGVYFRALSYDYTNHDDDVIVLNNLPFLKDASNIPEAIVMDAWFRHKEIELYRPLQNVSYIIDAQVGSDIIFSTHLTNLVIHILTCLAVFYLLTLLAFNRKYAFFGALIYAVHYLFLHAVIWIPARGDLLLALFAFLTMITFLLQVRTNVWYFYVLNVLAFSFALFAKETAIMLPFIFAIYLFLFNRKKIFTRKNAIVLACYIIIFFVYYFLRDMSIAKGEQQVSIKSFFLNIQTIPETIAKFFVPINFCTMVAYNLWATLLGLFIMAGFIVLFTVKKDLFSKLIVFAIVWFVFFLVPGMMYRPEFAPHTYDYLDHRAYLPALGAVIIILSLLHNLERKIKSKFSKNILTIGLVIFLLYLMGLNLVLNNIYKNPTSYSESAITHNDHSSLAYFIHAVEMKKTGAEEKAIEDYNNAIKYYPKFIDAHYNRAVILYEMQQYEAALEDLDFVIANKPDYGYSVYGMRGIVRSSLADYDGAEKDFTTALKINPDYAEGYKNMETLQQLKKNRPPALVEAEKLNALGIELAKSGNYKDALVLFEKANVKDPASSQIIFNLGNCLHAMGDTKAACEKWNIAAVRGNQGAKAMQEKFCK
ncbi:MAG TPA: tetratricopeptide repeat protein [Bacteroidales bacterium]|nr:tetratricopeptide repeat protein [Bacteroidales bacterium]HQI69837.1 tetratricopeptide repeat protein [Bacteroidales bacterium]